MHKGERFNTCTHLLGLMLAILGLLLMLAKTLPSGDLLRIAAGSVFMLSCVVLYAASTLFHGSQGEAKRLWQRLDHCAIHGLIAGSCTPFAMVLLPGLWGGLLVLALWGMAAFGIWRELSAKSPEPSLALYIGMGWVAVAVVLLMVQRLALGGLLWLLLGALLYTVGTVFYVNRAGYRHAHGCWHLFVLAGTSSHYVAITGVRALTAALTLEQSA